MSDNSLKLFNDTTLDKVPSNELASYFLQAIEKAKEELVLTLQESQEWQKQLAVLITHLKEKSLRYSANYPSLESILDMCGADFAKVFPLLTKNRGREKLLSYYENPSRTTPEVGEVAKFDDRDDMEESLEKFLRTFSAENHQGVLKAIRATLSDNYNGDIQENVQYASDVPSKYRYTLIEQNFIDIPHMLEEFVLAGAFRTLIDKERSLLLRMHSERMLIKALKVFQHLHAKQNTLNNELEKEECDENAPHIQQLNKDIADIRDFTFFYGVGRLTQLSLQTANEEPKN